MRGAGFGVGGFIPHRVDVSNGLDRFVSNGKVKKKSVYMACNANILDVSGSFLEH